MNDTNNKLTRLPLFVVHPLNISPQYIYQIVICLSFQVSVLYPSSPKSSTKMRLCSESSTGDWILRYGAEFLSQTGTLSIKLKLGNKCSLQVLAML